MENIFDLENPTRLTGFTRCVPGAVRRLDAFRIVEDTLVLRWKRPAGGALITGYRIERTRECRDYEAIGETQQTVFFIRNMPRDEPWFYRVTAFNARGAGGFRLVWLFRQTRAGKLLLVPIAATWGVAGIQLCARDNCLNLYW